MAGRDHIEVHGSPPDFARGADIAEEEAEDAMRRAVEWAATTLEAHAPRRTGRLASTIGRSVRSDGADVRGRVFPRAAYARYVIAGTGSYVANHKDITPRASRGPRAALRFADGRMRRRSRGQRPQPFVEEASAQARPVVTVLLEAGADRAADRIARTSDRTP